MATKLDQAIEELGRYFGVITKDAFVSKLVATEITSEEDVQNAKATPEEVKLASLFTDMTEGGIFTTDMIEKIKTMSAGASPEFKEKLSKIFLITYEGKEHAPGVPGVNQDIKISKMLHNEATKAGANGIADAKPVVNQQPKSPDKTNTAISVTQVFPSRLTLANRAANGVGIFCNALPTFELSRCMPYINITLVSSTPSLSEDGRVQTMSIMQFIKGQADLDQGSVDFDIASAVNSEVAAQKLSEPKPKNPTKKQQADAAARQAAIDLQRIPGMSSAGMEIFTAPQTMLPLNEVGILEDFSDMSPYQDVKAEKARTAAGKVETEKRSVGGRRATGVIDKFRPFLSFQNLKVSVTPTKGFMSHKTAEITIILHDRSRLSEVAPFVKPDLYGGTEMIIEYGWSHPDGGETSKNAFGTYLNELRVTEKYTIVNSSFSFDEVGQVTISAKLAMKGSASIDTTSIGKGPGVADAMEQVNNLTKAIAKLKAKVGGGSGGSVDVSGTSILSAAGSTSKALSIDDDTRKTITKFLKKNRNADSSTSTGELKDKLTELFGKDGKGGKAAAAKATIADGVARKVGVLNSSTDPFLREFKSDKGFTKWSKKTHFSLGKMLLVFCGEPLAATGRWDEIQFFFYAFNSKASYLANYNTSQMPINKSVFGSTFAEKTKTTANLPIKSFLGYIKSEFLVNQASDCFGLTALYENDDEGNKKVKEAFKEATALKDAKQLRLQDAYGNDQNDNVFKMPRMQMYIESVKVNDKESNPPPNSPGGATKTILRIHVYDSQCTPYESLGDMMKAARKDAMGLLGKSASKVRKKKEGDNQDVDPGHQKAMIDQLQAALDRDLLEMMPPEAGKKLDDIDLSKLKTKQFRIKGGTSALKQHVKSTMPSMTYGSQNTAIIKAQLSSQNNPKLATVNMLRGGMGAGTSAQGARDGGVPLQVSPTQLQLTMFGNPLLSFGQHFFIDFGTGTTVDNQYTITGLDHEIEAGKFESTVKLVQLDAFGTYTSMLGNITKAITVLGSSEK